MGVLFLWGIECLAYISGASLFLVFIFGCGGCVCGVSWGFGFVFGVWSRLCLCLRFVFLVGYLMFGVCVGISHWVFVGVR